MSNTRKYQIRQAILEGLNNRYPGGRTLDGLAKFTEVAQIDCTREELLTEARALEKVGHITNATGCGREPYFKIAATGVLQITKEAVLDEFVWGTDAL